MPTNYKNLNICPTPDESSLRYIDMPYEYFIQTQLRVCRKPACHILELSTRSCISLKSEIDFGVFQPRSPHTSIRQDSSTSLIVPEPVVLNLRASAHGGLGVPNLAGRHSLLAPVRIWEAHGTVIKFEPNLRLGTRSVGLIMCYHSCTTTYCLNMRPSVCERNP